MSTPSASTPSETQALLRRLFRDGGVPRAIVAVTQQGNRWCAMSHHMDAASADRAAAVLTEAGFADVEQAGYAVMGFLPHAEPGTLTVSVRAEVTDDSAAAAVLADLVEQARAEEPASDPADGLSPHLGATTAFGRVCLFLDTWRGMGNNRNLTAIAEVAGHRSADQNVTLDVRDIEELLAEVDDARDRDSM